ncbi:MAG TPA: 1-deoxy-D-xylulose-5-phosphate reductoisomerase [Blastocatellia bacterium]|nr:1-deoxy-D-xylulose-5-phosphate reductoisomerase [Blastocatellia bacterium]
MKRVAILGSTGSIGRNALEVIEHLKTYEVVGLAAGQSIDLLARQIKKYGPQIVSVGSEASVELLKKELAASGVPAAPKIGSGIEGLLEIVGHPDVEIVVVATVGAVGLLPTYRAIEMGKRIALANKETLVMAGELMTAKAAETGAELLPIDSEHNALHQCLRSVDRADVARLILTASGGPFRTTSPEELADVTPEQALQHPTWQMGRKITIDSATLMNKGLEVIEARWLFGFPPERIDILIHPQSIVHSMVELTDGSILAQLGVTDMRYAIQYALTYPERRPTPLPRLTFTPSLTLEFHPPDVERFPCLELAYRALRTGGTMPAVLNAANEIAVEAFLQRQIPFPAIAALIRTVMQEHEPQPVRSIEQIMEIDAWARRRARAHLPDVAASEARTQDAYR